eukprot:scaffold110289_cov30-Phaeocystis_antarctica.AAC.1
MQRRRRCCHHRRRCRRRRCAAAAAAVATIATIVATIAAARHCHAAVSLLPPVKPPAVGAPPVVTVPPAVTGRVLRATVAGPAPGVSSVVGAWIGVGIRGRGHMARSEIRMVWRWDYN